VEWAFQYVRNNCVFNDAKGLLRGSTCGKYLNIFSKDYRPNFNGRKKSRQVTGMAGTKKPKGKKAPKPKRPAKPGK
jgi:hypothetical protein